MDIKQKPKVPVTDADKAKHYFKYYEREPAFMAPQKMGKVFGPPMNPCDAVPFAERASILEEGFSKNEIGYCVMPDGTGYIADERYPYAISVVIEKGGAGGQMATELAAKALKKAVTTIR